MGQHYQNYLIYRGLCRTQYLHSHTNQEGSEQVLWPQEGPNGVETYPFQGHGFLVAHIWLYLWFASYVGITLQHPPLQTVSSQGYRSSFNKPWFWTHPQHCVNKKNFRLSGLKWYSLFIIIGLISGPCYQVTSFTPFAFYFFPLFFFLSFSVSDFLPFWRGCCSIAQAKLKFGLLLTQPPRVVDFPHTLLCFPLHIRNEGSNTAQN